MLIKSKNIGNQEFVMIFGSHGFDGILISGHQDLTHEYEHDLIMAQKYYCQVGKYLPLFVPELELKDGDSIIALVASAENDIPKLWTKSDLELFERICQIEADRLIECRKNISPVKRPPAVKKKIRVKILERDNRTCQECGLYHPLNTAPYPHIDHIKPHSKGGNDDPNNLQVLCGRCNRKKWNHYTEVQS